MVSSVAFDRLLRALAEAEAAMALGAVETAALALTDAEEALLCVATSLDPIRHPDARPQLQRVCAFCFTCLRDGRTGCVASIAAARSLLEPVGAAIDLQHELDRESEGSVTIPVPRALAS